MKMMKIVQKLHNREFENRGTSCMNIKHMHLCNLKKDQVETKESIN